MDADKYGIVTAVDDVHTNYCNYLAVFALDANTPRGGSIISDVE
jgi:hypothetical protein